ncbi:hypothetical protein BDV33DRAFT_194802 [Aspergillus novoparasiticus]|uniref:Frag1/DRAM/Sfk1 family-domain-containing protein n=1 Tax=Aspergillus novoparasiticus TaxID=986946 RepID=A0A5N6EEY8_9EURO|nr:hypothetical protein BDV33DRAFT_194802 [Aspergillus novoparasiticus]
MLAIAVWHFPIVSASIWLGWFLTTKYSIDKEWPHRDARSPAWEKVPIHTICAYSSILLSVAGSIGLILLSSFDYIKYTSVHYSKRSIDAEIAFRAAHSICAILLVVQSALACITSKWQHRMLFTIFIIRASLAIIEATLGIVFGFSSRHPGLDGDLSAILEWGKS